MFSVWMPQFLLQQLSDGLRWTVFLPQYLLLMLVWMALSGVLGYVSSALYWNARPLRFHFLGAVNARRMTMDYQQLLQPATQKLALARALYKDAPFLLLDEPTAALDAAAESALYRQYNAFKRGKGVLFVTHRLASTQFCDVIFLLDGGRIVQQGAPTTACWARRGVPHHVHGPEPVLSAGGGGGRQCIKICVSSTAAAPAC